MKIEKINKNNKRYFLYVLVVGVLLLSVISIKLTLAKYKTTESINIAKGTINYSLADLNVIAMYQKNDSDIYDEIDIMPGEGYVINEELSYCTIKGEEDTNAVIKTINGYHTFDNLQKGSKCYLYFDEGAKPFNDILAGYTINERNDFSVVYTTENENTIYTTEDDDGTSYYFAGNPLDNYVKFANFYWRIVRINGNGSIKLIYNGSSATASGTECIINDRYQTLSSSTDSIYTAFVGYMYTAGEAHGLSKSSNAKTVLENWYNTNIKSYGEYVDIETGFCNDRTPYSGNGYGTSMTVFKGWNRLDTNKSPSLKCENSLDYFTINTSSVGNKTLTYPIGLITADEVAYAGAVFKLNDSTTHFLDISSSYWTMTPYGGASGSYDMIFRVTDIGTLDYQYPRDYSVYLRPVINLKADTLFTGSGTSTDPYVVS